MNDTWKSLPMHTIPEPVRGYVLERAEALCCDPAMVAVPMLSLLAGSVGNGRALLMYNDWSVRSALWVAVVAESGTMKSPALNAVRETSEQPTLGWRIYRNQDFKFISKEVSQGESVCVTVWPSVFRRVICETTLAADLLAVMPPSSEFEYKDRGFSRERLERVKDVFQKLTRYGGKVICEPTPEAHEVFGLAVDCWNDEKRKANARGLFGGILIKRRGVAASLALIFHTVKCITGEVSDETSVDSSTMSEAIALADWFAIQQVRTYMMLGILEQDN